jgi:hypothetical protein
MDTDDVYFDGEDFVENDEDLREESPYYREDYPQTKRNSKKDSSEEANEFTNIREQFRFMLNFSEEKRGYTTVKIHGKKHKVMPILEFKQSGNFVLQFSDGSTKTVRLSDMTK